MRTAQLAAGRLTTRRRGVIRLVLGLGLSAACNRDPAPLSCADTQGAEARDWCHYRQAAELGQQGNTDDAIATIHLIQADPIRATAIDHLLSMNPPEMTQARADQLCTGLGPAQRPGCQRTWARPHLWTDAE